MDVAGALVEGVLPQPVHHLHHALVVGVELFVAAAQLHQLLEAGAARVAAGLLRRAHRLGQCEELHRVTLDLARAGQHPAHRAPRLAFHLGHPVGQKGLGRGHHHLGRRHLHRQHAVALGVGRAHDVGHLAHVDLERIDTQVLHPEARGQPLGQRLDVQRLAVAGAAHRHAGQPHQRVLHALGLRAAGDGALCLLGGDQAVVAGPLHQAAPVDRALMGSGCGQGF